MWIDVDPSAWALYKQANDSRLIASERKGAIDLLAEKGYSTNPKRTDWMLATTANDPTLMPSERSHIYQLMRKGLQSQQGDL